MLSTIKCSQAQNSTWAHTSFCEEYNVHISTQFRIELQNSKTKLQQQKEIFLAMQIEIFCTVCFLTDLLLFIKNFMITLLILYYITNQIIMVFSLLFSNYTTRHTAKTLNHQDHKSSIFANIISLSL